MWFRQNHRNRDNPALLAAVDAGCPLVPLYTVDERPGNPWKPGAASRWWLAESLDSLNRDLACVGSRLVRKRGDPSRFLRALQLGCAYWNDSHEPWIHERDEQLRAELRRVGTRVETFNASTLFNPGDIRAASGNRFRIYSAFARACEEPPAPRPTPARLPVPEAWPKSDRLDLVPGNPEWADRLRAPWSPGSAAARSRLAAFNIDGYADTRNMPAIEGISRLSPHPLFGEVGPREVWSFFAGRTSPGAARYRGELLWREFAHHLLHHFPDLPGRPLQKRFLRFPWRQDSAELERWQRGHTGYPIVDAGMQELWQTGWMHNRVRMIVGSFLTRHLLIDWQDGARWFWDTLVDADPVNNAAGWQWIAGCGADAVPYFRTFNPLLQGDKFDSDGACVRRRVPDLRSLPSGSIHKPWTLPTPPDGYPAPHGRPPVRAQARAGRVPQDGQCKRRERQCPRR